MTFDQVFGYPNSIQDVLHQIEKDKKKKNKANFPTKKKPAFIPNKIKKTSGYKNVSKCCYYLLYEENLKLNLNAENKEQLKLKIIIGRYTYQKCSS